MLCFFSRDGDLSLLQNLQDEGARKLLCFEVFCRNVLDEGVLGTGSFIIESKVNQRVPMQKLAGSCGKKWKKVSCALRGPA